MLVNRFETNGKPIRGHLSGSSLSGALGATRTPGLLVRSPYAVCPLSPRVSAINDLHLRAVSNHPRFPPVSAVVATSVATSTGSPVSGSRSSARRTNCRNAINARCLWSIPAEVERQHQRCDGIVRQLKAGVAVEAKEGCRRAPGTAIGCTISGIQRAQRAAMAEVARTKQLSSW